MDAGIANGTHEKFTSMPNFRRVNARYVDITGTERSTKLYRSSRPDYLTQNEAQTFINLGIRSIIDCRSGTEYNKANGTKILDHYYPLCKVKLPLYRKLKISDPIAYKTMKSSSSNGSVSSHEESIPGKHYLVNFFKMNYIMAVFNKAPWYLKLYSLLFLLVDVIMNTGFRYFIRMFARNVLNKQGLAGQYKDILRLSQNQIFAGE